MTFSDLFTSPREPRGINESQRRLAHKGSTIRELIVWLILLLLR